MGAPYLFRMDAEAGVCIANFSDCVYVVVCVSAVLECVLGCKRQLHMMAGGIFGLCSDEPRPLL